MEGLSEFLFGVHRGSIPAQRRAKRSSISYLYSQVGKSSVSGSLSGKTKAGAASFDETSVSVDSVGFAELADYETDYSDRWKYEVEPSVKYWMLGGVVGFLILLAIEVGLYASGTHDGDPSIVESDFPFAVPAAIFAVLLLLDLLSLAFPTISRPPQLITLASATVRLGATFSYVARALDLVPNLVMREGSWIIPVRYVDWLVTTPALIALLGSMVEAPAPLLRTTVVADVLTIVLGIIARPVPPGAKWTLFAISCMCFAVAMWGCALMLQDAHSRALNEASRRRVVAVSAVVGLMLCIYPLVFVLEAAGGISTFERDLCIACADVAAKIGVTAVLSRMSILRFSEELDMSAAVMQHIAGEKHRLLETIRRRVDPSLYKQLYSIEELRRVLVADGGHGKAETAAAAVFIRSSGSADGEMGQSSSSMVEAGASSGKTARRRAPRSKLFGDKDESTSMRSGAASAAPYQLSSIGSMQSVQSMTGSQTFSAFLEPTEVLDNIYSLALGMSKAMEDVAIYEQATSGTLAARIAPLQPKALYRPVRSRIRGLSLRRNISTEFLWLDRDGFVDEVGAVVDTRALQFVLLTTVHAAVQSAGRNGSVLVLCEVLPHHPRSAYRAPQWDRGAAAGSGQVDGSYFLRVLVCDSGAQSDDLDPAVRQRKSELQTRLMVDQRSKMDADRAAMYRRQARQDADRERQSFSMYSRGVTEEQSPAEAISALHPDRPTDARMTVRELTALGLATPSVVDSGRSATTMEMGLCRFMVERMRGSVRLLRGLPEELLATAREAGRQQGWNLPGSWGINVRDGSMDSEFDGRSGTGTTGRYGHDDSVLVASGKPAPPVDLTAETGPTTPESEGDEEAASPPSERMYTGEQGQNSAEASEDMVRVAAATDQAKSTSSRNRVLEAERAKRSGYGKRSRRPRSAGATQGVQEGSAVAASDLKYILEIIVPLHTIRGIAMLARDEGKLQAFLGEYGASYLLPQLKQGPGGIFSMS